MSRTHVPTRLGAVALAMLAGCNVTYLYIGYYETNVVSGTTGSGGKGMGGAGATGGQGSGGIGGAGGIGGVGTGGTGGEAGDAGDAGDAEDAGDACASGSYVTAASCVDGGPPCGVVLGECCTASLIQCAAAEGCQVTCTM